MTSLVRWGLFSLLLTLSGCSWFEDDEDDAFRPAELQDIEERFEVDVLWSEDVGDGVGEYYNKLHPVVANNVTGNTQALAQRAKAWSERWMPRPGNQSGKQN